MPMLQLRSPSGRHQLRAAKGVISSAGYMNTFDRMLPEGKAARLSCRCLFLSHRRGFVMVNLGSRAGAEFGVKNETSVTTRRPPTGTSSSL